LGIMAVSRPLAAEGMRPGCEVGFLQVGPGEGDPFQSIPFDAKQYLARLPVLNLDHIANPTPPGSSYAQVPRPADWLLRAVERLGSAPWASVGVLRAYGTRWRRA
jgi:hypothetical protein